ncbi:unnamed protein product [Clonostachys rosea]|uniref:Uncharacterized protein n=1 Tax=Bionectria ochroleuca TaxID=29856 RepID=A0ABY6U5M1_BIOOC|nr:unnamed protein product [Clonostachys rosea]
MQSTSPTAVSYRGELYAFWVGSDDGGIYYSTKSSKDSNWGSVQALAGYVSGIAVDQNTSPCAAVYQDKLYVFYNGRGQDGTFFAQRTRSGWESKVTALVDKVPSKQMGFDRNTSPAAATHNGMLHVFWCGSGSDGIYRFTLQGNEWTYRERISGPISLAFHTSPCAYSTTKDLYVFYNGGGRDGTYYITYNGDKDKPWNNPISVRATMEGGMDTLHCTSPSFVASNSGKPRLFWVGSGGVEEGLWFSEKSGDSFERQRQLTYEIRDGGHWGNPGIRTSPAAATFDIVDAEQKVLECIPFVFWAGDTSNDSKPTAPIYFAAG